MSHKQPGTFVISLDFELFWGVYDVLTIEEYKENILGAHDVVLKLLEKFKQYHIHATWAIVGMLYSENTKELLETFPQVQPSYLQKSLSAYHYILSNPIHKQEDLFFAPHLIRKIQTTPLQEIATHTFSHYYTLEEGQTKNEFRNDLSLSLQISRNHGSDVKSIIFPRNQINEDYLEECFQLGLIAYRGNEDCWIYQIQRNERRRYIKRGLRLLNEYINLFGHQTYPIPTGKNLLVNIKSSRFLRPYVPKLKFLESLRLKRIKDDMTYAAKKGEVYHLWWHPHNFGIYTEKNMEFLEEILKHFSFLNKNYLFRSRNMKEIALEAKGLS